MGRSRSVALVAALFGVVLSLTAPTTAPAANAALSQSVDLRALPQLADPGAEPRPAAAALTTLEASFTPVVPDRVSILHVRRGSYWVEVARGSQDATGRSSFQAAYATNGTPETYRVVAAGTSSYQEATSGTVSTSAWGAPIFSDEFSGTALSWPWDQRYQGYEVASRSCSKTDPRASVVGDGVLALKVLDDPERNDVCNYTVNNEPLSTFYRINGHVGTHGRFAYRYGVAAARVKFQDPRGQHGAFWMQPQGTGYGAEIDVIEWFGNGSFGLASSVWDYSSGTPVRAAGGFIDNQPAFGANWAETYHVFSVEWTPTEYIFRIDGKVSLRTTAGVSQTEEYLILSLLVSNWEAANLPSRDSLPTSMDVDWVRVWQNDLDLVLQPEAMTPTAKPSISGEPKVGSTLTASSGSWSSDGATFSYQWRRNGNPIANATAATYAVTSADVDATLTVAVSATKAGYLGGTEVSNAVTGKFGDAPKASVAPSITGDPQVGSTLTAAPGSWNLAGVGFAYQWTRNGSPIAGATDASYAVAAADASTGLAVTVSATKTGHQSGTAASGAVQVAAVPVVDTTPPVISPPVISPPAITPPVTTAPVLKAESKTNLKAPARAVAGKRVKVTVSVSTSAAPAVTGKVVIKAGKKTLGSGTLKSGKVTIKLKKLTPGKYKLVAGYAGSATVLTSASKKATLKVVKAAS